MAKASSTLPPAGKGFRDEQRVGGGGQSGVGLAGLSGNANAGYLRAEDAAAVVQIDQGRVGWCRQDAGRVLGDDVHGQGAAAVRGDHGVGQSAG
jgi:hypothetical protein